MKHHSNIDLSEAAHVLQQAQRILVTAHAKPDGDAVGAVLALTGALRALGKQADGYFMPPVPPTLAKLRGMEWTRLYQGQALEEYDLYVVLDTGAWSQLTPMRPVLDAHVDKLLVVDHHVTGDVPAKWCYVDVHAAACAEVVALIIEQLCPPNGQVADSAYQGPIDEALYVGIVSDTGWFRFSNARPLTHRLAAILLEHGVDHARLYQLLEQTERPEKIALLARALTSMRILADGKAALMVLRPEDFAETGAGMDETERLVDFPQMISEVQVVALVSRLPGEKENHGPVVTRVSFRSKPGAQPVDVARLAQQFGGGGHMRAAGAKIQQPLETVVERVAGALEQALSDAKNPI